MGAIPDANGNREGDMPFRLRYGVHASTRSRVTATIRTGVIST